MLDGWFDQQLVRNGPKQWRVQCTFLLVASCEKISIEPVNIARSRWIADLIRSHFIARGFPTVWKSVSKTSRKADLNPLTVLLNSALSPLASIPPNKPAWSRRHRGAPSVSSCSDTFCGSIMADKREISCLGIFKTKRISRNERKKVVCFYLIIARRCRSEYQHSEQWIGSWWIYDCGPW
jgi:hypothetical protein